MTSLDNILEFIDKSNISIRQFESESGLANGTINENRKRGADLSSKNIEKISKRFGLDLTKFGFLIQDLKAYGRPGELAVVKKTTDNSPTELENTHMPSTIEQLAKALVDQAEASKLQASANKEYAEGFKVLVMVLERIEKNMARQDSQARIEANLNEALAGIETLSIDSEKVMADLQILKAGKTASSEGDGNK